MPRSASPAVLVIGGLAAAACYGGDAGAEGPVADTPELDCYVARGTLTETQDRPSPLRTVELSFQNGAGLLCYGAPSARGRTVMGELVPYGMPWRIGANEPTTLHLSAPANVGGVALEPGSYSLYAVPGPDEWQFLINSNWERWGIPIDDAVRSTEIGSFAVTPGTSDETVETLSYSWAPQPGGMGDLVLEWENARLAIHVHPGM